MEVVLKLVVVAVVAVLVVVVAAAVAVVVVAVEGIPLVIAPNTCLGWVGTCST